MTSLLANDINDTSCLCSFLDSYCGTKAPVFDMLVISIFLLSTGVYH